MNDTDIKCPFCKEIFIFHFSRLFIVTTIGDFIYSGRCFNCGGICYVNSSDIYKKKLEKIERFNKAQKEAEKWLIETDIQYHSENCGCGFRSSDGKIVHNGLIKPEIVKWYDERNIHKKLSKQIKAWE